MAQEAMEAYLGAWNAIEPDARRALLEQALVEGAFVAYPNAESRGWEGLSARIARLHERHPGGRFVYTSRVEVHHGWLRATWSLVMPDGTVRLEGEDVAEVASDGRLALVIGFFDPLPPPA